MTLRKGFDKILISTLAGIYKAKYVMNKNQYNTYFSHKGGRLVQDSSKLSYSPGLDGLRGFAILGVMIFHARYPFLEGGFIGVDIFFVLSGFLITYLLVSEFDQYGSVSLRNFYMRRLLRLGPALLALLFAFCLASFLFLSSQKATSNYIDSLISLAYLSNWARAFSIHPPDLLGHTWSLSIEEQFYIIWPIILLTMLRLSKNRSQVVILAAITAISSWIVRVYLLSNGATPERLYNGLDTRADALMVGCTIGVAMSSGLLMKNHRETLSKIFIFMAPISVACLLGRWRSPVMYQFGFFTIDIMATILVIDVLINPRSLIRKLLGMRWLVWVGRISYSLYLWHYPIYRALFAFKFSSLAVLTWGSLATFLVASMSHYFMEKPLLKLKIYFTHTTANKASS